ncbi:MAG: SUMF1/EgtB/PvdO family nonheme iron enzyme [Polyangiaceae bacterium]|nr:SUMF1/EgtB/PvdO family nonheme iron enzyme [Polyangiaceae bacterium]
MLLGCVLLGSRRRIAHLAAGLLCLLALSSCQCESDDPAPLTVAPQPSAQPSQPPQVLYLPEAGSLLPPSAITGDSPDWESCPAEMVAVGAGYCIDRFEGALVDDASGRALSPYYHPTRKRTAESYKRWKRLRFEVGPASARALPVPRPPEWQLTEMVKIRAVSERSQIPNGYINAVLAKTACENAGKRLCTSEEWVRACRGESGRQFPYSDVYRPEICNVFGSVHPARALHSDTSMGHLDPRLNLVQVDGRTVLQPAGGTSECASEWGDDQIYDMVGNVDEWVSDADGVFRGGFYARATKEGCEAKVTVHSPEYFDYSTGFRCCRSAQ